MTDRLAPLACPWAELPPELLGDVSSRLCDAADFVRFPAVCRQWRDALLSNATRAMFLPWILARQDKTIMHSVINFAPSSYRHRSRNDIVLAEPPGASSTAGERNWVARADGTAACVFRWSPEPGLVDLLTGAITRLHGFPEDDETKRSMENPRGIVYDDGTIFLYAFTYDYTLENGVGQYLTVAIWRPGDAEWKFMVHRVPALGGYHLGYHGGKVLVMHGRASYWCVLMPDFEANDDRFVEAWNHTIDETKYTLDYSYVLESCGELMCASVLVDHKFYDSAGDNPRSHAFLVKVRALRGVGGGGEMGWVERDNLSLDDRVFFLGCPASFAADAAKLNMGGGCVFFTFGRSVFRYSLLDGEAQLLMRQCPGWSIDRTCVWLQPQPTIAPIQQIRERLAGRTIQEQEK